MDSELSSSQTETSCDNSIKTCSKYTAFIGQEIVVFSRMNDSLKKLTEQLIIEHNLNNPEVLPDIHGRPIMIRLKIEAIFADLLKQVLENRDPVLRIRDRETWTNCFFDNTLCLKIDEECSHREIKFSARKSLPKFSLIFFLLGKIYKLLCSGESCTKRELYYQNLDFISDQSSLDAALNEISCLLDCPLYHLNLFATSKGLVSGPLKIVTSRDIIDCGIDNAADHSRGVMIPIDVSNITDLQTDATFVLLIEKDAVFQKLLENEAMKKLPPCVFVTGKGMPDINTRSLLKTIWDMLHIPILAFVDADPWGIDIMCVYRFGSRVNEISALSHQADSLAVPCIRWIGPFPSEISKLCNNTSSLNLLDKAKLTDMLKRPYIKDNKKINSEIDYMLTMNMKAEIEDLEFSAGYMANVFLPHKIATGEFL